MTNKLNTMGIIKQQCYYENLIAANEQTGKKALLFVILDTCFYAFGSFHKQCHFIKVILAPEKKIY